MGEAMQITPDGSPVITPSAIEETARNSGIPVRVRFGRGDYVHEWLNFRCPLYSPRGGDPDYIRGKYNNDSKDCSCTVRVIDGVRYHAPFTCRKESNGSEYWPNIRLPGKYSPKHEIRDITAGLKFLWRLV